MRKIILNLILCLIAPILSAQITPDYSFNEFDLINQSVTFYETFLIYMEDALESGDVLNTEYLFEEFETDMSLFLDWEQLAIWYTELEVKISELHIQKTELEYNEIENEVRDFAVKLFMLRENLKRAKSITNEIRNTYQKGMGNPVFHELITLDWFELINTTLPALSKLQTTVSNKINQLGAEFKLD